jgi:DNA adenine methylase
LRKECSQIDYTILREIIMTNSPLKWHGGKYYLAEKIISLFPFHLHYVEPFFGSGAVLFRKSCEGVSEVVNDLDDELTNFWQVLQLGVLDFSLVPFSQVEWRNSFIDTTNAVARAKNFFIRYRQSRQGLGKDFATLSKNRIRRGMSEQVSSWLSAVDLLPEAVERLKRVVIFNDAATKIIKQQDGGNTLFYLDPPYLGKHYYSCTMSQEDHIRLLMLTKTLRGKVIISSYPSDLYNRLLGDWNRVVVQIDNKASSSKIKGIESECLWMNY